MAVTRDDVIRVAAGELGYAENPPGSNHTKYGAWYGLDGYAWCAMFVSWVFAQAGMPLHISTKKGYAACRLGVAWFQQQGRWHTSKPQAGDIVFYTFSHTGIVVSVNSDGSINTIEGNTDERGGRTGGKVMRRTRYANILGYGRPEYAVAAAPATQPAIGTTAHRHLTPLVRVRNKRAEVYHADRRIWFVQQSGDAWGEIADVQRHLRDAGAADRNGNLPNADGLATPEHGGPALDDAIKNLQAMRHLPDDGVVGNATWAELHRGAA